MNDNKTVQINGPLMVFSLSASYAGFLAWNI